MYSNVLDNKKIKDLRSKLGLTQTELVERIEKEVGYPISLKTLQRIEKGDQVNEKFIHLLAIYLDKNLSRIPLGYENSITANNLMLQNINPKNLSPQNIQNDQIYLHKVNDFNDVINTKKFDNGGRKFLFESPPTNNDDLDFRDLDNYSIEGKPLPNSELELIKKLLKLISEEKITDTKYYNELEKDFKNLDNLSEFNQAYKELKENFGTYIYAGNYDARFLDLGFDMPNYIAQTNCYTYSVFYFSKDSEPARIFNFRTNRNNENFNLAIKRCNKELKLELDPPTDGYDNEDEFDALVNRDLERIHNEFQYYIKMNFGYLVAHEELTTDKITVVPINFPKMDDSE